MIVAFIGRTQSGKGTQANLLSEATGLTLFAMGDIIREARASNEAVEQAYQQYAMRGKHLPNSVKFPLLKSRIDKENSFVLDNYPATPEDLKTFNDYLTERELSVNKVFYMVISEDELIRRMKAQNRGRLDDEENIVRERLRIQDQDREPVLLYFRSKGILEEINGEREVSMIHGDIMSRLTIGHKEKNGDF